MAAKMTLGPVVGKVTADTARILVEADGNAEATCVLTDTEGAEASMKVKLRGGRPGLLAFSGLAADTVYRVSFRGLDAARAGRVITRPAAPDGLTCAVVSCNNTPHRGDTNLWQDLYFRYVAPAEVDLAIHLGDQVYGDRAYEGALGILGGKVQEGVVAAAAKAKGNSREERAILELYRQLYRWAWNFPATQWTLAHVANLMIWDDHEIRDDWGSRPADREPGTPEHYVGTLARRVYREYQRQLWDDFDVDAAAPADQIEDHAHVFGSIGVLFVDQRGARSFAHDPTRPYLGTPQWERIRTSLEQGPLSRCRILLVATSVPLVYLGSSTSGVGSAVINDLRDHWSFGPHQKEQIELIRALRRWKEASADRDLLVLGGDVHIGGKTEIRHQGSPVFRQLITSPITNAPPAFFAFAAIRLLSEQEETLGDSYSFEHSEFTRRRNFGIVVARVPAAGTAPRLEGSLVEGA